MTGGVWLGLAVVALGVGSVFSALSQSLREVSRARLEEIAAIRNRRGSTARVGRILDDVQGHATSIALPRILANLAVVVGIVMWITGLRGVPAPTWVEGLLGVLFSSLLLWVFGVVLPHSVARHAGESTVYAWSGFLRAAYVLTGPLKLLADGVDEMVRRLAGRTEMDEAEELQEELLSAVADAEDEGAFDQKERDMIEAVVRMRDKTVIQIMTPRTEIAAMELSNNLGVVTQTIRAIGHSRIPVYDGDLDHIVGVFYVKDLMRWLAGENGGARGGKPFDLRALLRPAMFIPESKTIRELLGELLAKRVHMAIVADEYGGTAGLVTFEDLVEEVFGDIQDEYELPEDQTSEVRVDSSKREAEVDARAYIGDVNSDLKPLGIELPESEDYDTVGGFVTVTLGRIPAAGETFQHDGISVTVIAAEPTRVTRVRLGAVQSQENAQGAGIAGQRD
ncbi:MAG: hemolysin family protein [Phycisphaerales bacterium]